MGLALINLLRLYAIKPNQTKPRFKIPYIWTVSNLKSRKFFGKIRTVFFEELIHDLRDSDYSPNHWRSQSKKSSSNTIVRWFLWSIWLYTQREDGINTTSIWSSQIKCYFYNYALQKHESISSLTWWRQRLLRHCRWSFVRRYISTIFIYNLLRIRTLNIDRSNKNRSTIRKARSRQCPEETITD